MSCRLSVVIVTWNVREDVIACLESLYCDAAVAPVELEVIVVDNDSTDGTVESIRQRYPQVAVHANSTNVGFPLANNQALRHARGEYVLLLNPDTEIRTGTLRACLDVLDGNSEIGMVGCRLELEDGSVQLECARRPYLLQHLLLEALYLHMLFPRNRICGDHLMSWWDHRGERDVEAISGAFMMARREVMEQVGGLPAELFMYHEDLAFCLRARRAGWRVRYLGGHSVLHRWRGSSRKSSETLALLEGECKVRLIREAQGPMAGSAARAAFGVRCAIRLVVGGIGMLLPGRSARASRYPRVFDWRIHWLQLVWTLRPGRVAHRMPQPVLPPDPPHAATALSSGR
ncbi:glycosyltransferase family 2 protein [soil metagenome]